jgi:hypothetical protein
MYAPFVYAPDIIAPSHAFAVYAPGTTPDPLGLLQTRRHSGGYQAEEDEDEDDIMPSETDNEALAAELVAEARLDATDVRAAAAYEATASSGDAKTTRAPERGCGDGRSGQRSRIIMRWGTTLIITACICVSGGKMSRAGGGAGGHAEESGWRPGEERGGDRGLIIQMSIWVMVLWY